MFYEIIEVIMLVVMLAVVTFFWFKNDNSLWKALLFTVFTCGIFYLNIPNFLSIVEGTQVKNIFFSIPFTLYNTLGTIYIVCTNILLALIGIYLGKSKNNKLSRKKTKERFDHFSSDATKLKIIGRDLRFLLNNDNIEYRTQREKIRNLGNNAKLLCARTDDSELIDLYHDLLKNGIQIRSYTARDGIANLKGQIKIDELNKRSGLFVLKTPQPPKFFCKSAQSNLFEITGIRNGYLLEAVDQQFDKTFSNSLHPVIRCIALDLGGVYFDGDIDQFYDYLWKNYSITIKKRAKDRLNIDDDLMCGKITVREFITQRALKKDVLAKLTEKDWEKILNQWQNTWQPNPKIRQVIMSLSQFGYNIVPFSNLDQQNGEKYIREHYLPECCTNYFFSYEQKKPKPSKNAFIAFTELAKEKRYIQAPWQILLIDDEIKNLETASAQEWEILQFYNDSSPNAVVELVQKLKQMNILPEDYSV